MDELLVVFKNIVLDPDFWLLNKLHWDTPTGPSKFLQHLYLNPMNWDPALRECCHCTGLLLLLHQLGLALQLCTIPCPTFRCRVCGCTDRGRGGHG